MALTAKCPKCRSTIDIAFLDHREEAFSNGYNQGFAEAIQIAPDYGVDISAYIDTQAHLSNGDMDLSQYLGEDLDYVRERMERPEERLAEDWGNWTGTTEEYYINRKDYLYDNMKYNRFQYYQQRRILPLVGMKNKKILDIGCGVGTLVFMLGESNDIIGWDINPMMIDFAKWKKDKYELKGAFTTELPDISQFDVVTALGTLEHFENLEEFVKGTLSQMRHGAKLLHFDDFGQQNVSPMHYDFTDEMPVWLDEAGFVEWDDLWAVKS